MPHSVKKRYFVSFLSNVLRSVFSFLTGLVVARGLGPGGYGEMSFLLGSFGAFRALIDLGTSNAFYTFISQESRPVRYYSFYGLWLAFQFMLTAVLVAWIMPASLVEDIWLGHGRSAILLSFAASFFQQQVWLTVNQIAEAARKTIKAQYLNIAVAVFYLGSVSLLSFYGAISVRAVLLLMVLQYAVASLAAVKVLGPVDIVPSPGGRPVALREMLAKYRAYCAPLLAMSVAGFVYDFSDRWMLQHFGGANQQGFYQAAFQFAAISVLATTSILNIFWKEMAEATRLNDTERIYRIFLKVSRGLYTFGALLSGFLIPWSGEITGTFLGEAYSPAGPVLALMFLYPLHQSLGQIAGTMLLAGERTKQYMAISVAAMLVSLPVSYLLQAPAHGLPVPGLGLGAMGMALKMVGLNIISVNALLWVITRNQGWKFDYLYQIAGPGAMLAAGFAVRTGAAQVFGDLVSTDKFRFLPPFLLSGGAYLILACAILWLMPWLAAMDRDEIRGYIIKVRALAYR